MMLMAVIRIKKSRAVRITFLTCIDYELVMRTIVFIVEYDR